MSVIDQVIGIILRACRYWEKRAAGAEQRKKAVDNLLPNRIAAVCSTQIKAGAVFSQRHFAHLYRFRLDRDGKPDFCNFADILLPH